MAKNTDRQHAPFKLIDLFSGAGGMTLGFAGLMAGKGKPLFNSVWANDINDYAAKTYNANFGSHCTSGDIVDIIMDKNIKIPKADVVIGGPPCQGFSLLNKNRISDPRKQLWRPFMDVVESSGASVFVMENVRQLLTSDEMVMIEERANLLGFKVAKRLICAADYGVPQLRFRAIIVGARGVLPDLAFPPKKTHYNPVEYPKSTKLYSEYVDNPEPWKTVRDAISDLPNPKGTELRVLPGPLSLHFGRNPTEKSIERYKAVPPGGNRFDLQRNAPELTPQCWINKASGGTDLFGRLYWDKPSVTIRTEFYKPEKGRYLHPVKNRPITHREAARIQSFPDDFVFVGSKTEIAKQIGNAVPPALAREIAKSVHALLLGDLRVMDLLVIKDDNRVFA